MATLLQTQQMSSEQGVEMGDEAFADHYQEDTASSSSSSSPSPSRKTSASSSNYSCESNNNVRVATVAADDEVVNLVRSRFMEHFESNPSLYDHDDVQRNVVNSARFIRRFLYAASDQQDAALERLVNCFQWRRAHVVPLKGSDFPIEYYRSGGIFEFGHDKTGTPLLYMRIRTVRKCHELDDDLRRFLAFHINRMDEKRSTPESDDLLNWGIVFDCSSIGLANVQIDMLKYLISTLREYFPCGVKTIYVYDVPWMLNAVQKMVCGMLPAEARQLIKFRNRKTILELIDKEQLPAYMGGSSKLDFRAVPDPAWTCGTFDEVMKNSPNAQQFDAKQMERIHQYFDALAILE